MKDVRELATALQQFNAFDPADMNQAVNMMRQYNDSDHVGVGIKTILTVAESASMVNDPASWFAEQLARAIATNNPTIGL